jgi:uncharacterized DUF497 family protein
MGLLPEYFPDLTGFQWDSGNSAKNWRRHEVTQAECEQVLFLRPIVVASDPGHSDREARYFLLGRTASGRELTIVFTVRGSLVRVISAGPMSRRERSVYGNLEASEEAPEGDPELPD